MLEIELSRAMAPDEMEEAACGICGLEFWPDAVIATIVGDPECRPVCEVCLKHLATRADEEPIPTDWGEIYRRYVREHTEPVFPSVEALVEEEGRCPIGYGLARPRL